MLSEVFLRAYSGLRHYDERWPDARPWLYGITRNVLREHWRRRSPGRTAWHVDQAVLDAAVRKLTESIGADASYVPARRQAIRCRPGRIAGGAVAAALAAAAVFAAVAWLGHSVPTTRPAARSSSATSPVRPTIAAIMTAFSASSDDILKVTKVVRGEGTCCKTIIWISPASPAPGAAVRARIQTFTTGGTRLSDMALTFTAPATAPAAAGTGCAAIFLRPKVALPPATGLPGTLTLVDYLSRIWVKGNIRVQAATTPSAAALRACLKGGQWHDVGQRVLAGEKTSELVSADGSERLWASASTFLPVRLTSIAPTPYGPTIITFTFRFLRPTAANQAALAPPPVPAGFSRQRL